jgi:hypothetical protein
MIIRLVAGITRVTEAATMVTALLVGCNALLAGIHS